METTASAARTAKSAAVKLSPTVDDVQEMMGSTGPFLGAGLVRPDVESPVNLHRVGVDDFAAEAFRQEKRDGGLAHRRGPTTAAARAGQRRIRRRA